MKKIPLTQGKFAVVDDEDYEQLSKKKWFAVKGAYNWYAARDQRINGKKTRILMHRQLTNCPDGKEVHHRNRGSLDNWRSNLEVCTRIQNLNKRVYKKKRAATAALAICFIFSSLLTSSCLGSDQARYRRKEKFDGIRGRVIRAVWMLGCADLTDRSLVTSHKVTSDKIICLRCHDTKN